MKHGHTSKALRMLALSFFMMLGAFFSIEANAQGAEQEAEEQRTIVANSALNYELLEHNQNIRKSRILLDALSEDRIGNGKIYIGASLTAIMDYQQSNKDSKFAYLMRHPTSNNQIGKVASEAVLHSAQIMLAGSVSDWLTVYSEVLYDPEQSFGAGTITALTRNQLQLRRGYVLFGNLSTFPVYGVLGKMDINFGNQNSVSPFTNSTMWHAFSGLGYGALLGVNASGIDVSFTAIQGGSQFRALHTPIEGTNVPSRLNNFAVDANYTLGLGESAALNVGGSYVKGTAYCQGFPIVHFQPCEAANPASTFYGSLNTVGGFTIMGAYASTANDWPGSFNPNPPLDVWEATKVTSLVAGASYKISDNGMYAFTLSGEFSNFVAGPDGSPWDRQNQYVLGGSLMIHKSSKLFIELFRTEGYAPLNFLSGGNFEDQGVTHADRDARSHGIVFGGQIVL